MTNHDIKPLLEGYSKTCTAMLCLWATANDESLLDQMLNPDGNVIRVSVAEQMARDISAMRASINRAIRHLDEDREREFLTGVIT